MPITIQTLQNTSITTITDTFNLAFSDYFVPFRMSVQQMETKITSENVQLECSAGAFRDGQLVGFIMHAIDTLNGKKVAWNAGTGVIPGQRGQHITAQLYDFIIPALKNTGVSSVQLEVIAENVPAIKTYQNSGFRIKRELECWKGTITTTLPDIAFKCRLFTGFDWPHLQSFWDWQPTWQNSANTLEQLKSNLALLGAFDNEQHIGYLIINPVTRRIQQFAVRPEYRRKGVGKLLFHEAATRWGNEVILINIDGCAQKSLSFLKNIGLDFFLRQYEMELVF